MEPETKPETTRNVLDFSQKLEIWMQLRKVCFCHRDGHCIYRDDWSDANVAEVMTFKCTTGHVARIREKQFGKLDTDAKSVPAEVFERLDDLNARVGVLEMMTTHQVKDLESGNPAPVPDPSMQTTSATPPAEVD